MNPLQTLIAFINQWIYTNGNNEITAATLNPVLQAIAQWANGVMGDPATLNTATQASLVAAINEVNSALSNISNAGIKVHTGTADPNETPPTSFNNADFYMLTTESGAPVELYQYNGYTWVSTQQGVDGSTIPVINPTTGLTSMLNTALQDILYQSAEDEILSMGVITVVDNDVIIPTDAEWVINMNQYTNVEAIAIPIPLEEVGYNRTDLIVLGEGDDNVYRFPGVSTNTGISPTPEVPDNTLVASVVSVNGNTIGVTQPVIDVPGRGQNKVLYATFADFGVTAFSEITDVMIRDFAIAANVPDVENYAVIVEHEDAPILPSVLTFTMTDLETAVLPYNITDVNDVAQWNASLFVFTAGAAAGDFDTVLIEGNTVTLTASGGSEIVNISLDEAALTEVIEVSSFSGLTTLSASSSSITEFEPIMTGSNPTSVEIISNPQLTQIPTTLNFEALQYLAIYDCALTETSINAFLIARRNEEVIGKEYLLTGENSAYPTGDGAIALADLISAGNTVSVNEAP